MSATAAIRHPRVRPGRDVIRTALLLGFVLLSIAPVALGSVPAMVDYPNHLARMSILARAGSGAAHPLYEVSWALYPNLAMDLVVPPLAHMLGVETATRLFYVAGQLLVVGGAAVLALAVRGRAIGAAFTATTLLYSVPFAWGFVNFEFALGLALWGIAGFVAIGPERLRLRFGLHAAAVAILFVAHLFALGLYAATLGFLELWRLARSRAPLVAYATTAATLAIPLAAAALVMTATGGAVGGARTDWVFAAKPGWLFALNGFDRPLSISLTAILAMLGYVAFRQGWLRLVGAGPAVAAGFALLYLAMPFRLFDTSFVDVRVLVAAALILPAFVTVAVPPGAARLVAGGIVGAVAVANVAFVGIFQAGYRDDYAEVVAALDRTERGARLIVADAGEADDPPDDLRRYPMYHAATLAVMTRDAFVPTLFTHPGKQPVLPRAALRRLALREGGPIPLADLAAIARGAAPNDTLRHVADWTHDFDYLFVLRRDGEMPDLPGLAPVASGRRFSLLRITTASRRATEP